MPVSKRAAPYQDEPFMRIAAVGSALPKELQLAITKVGGPHTACSQHTPMVMYL